MQQQPERLLRLAIQVATRIAGPDRCAPMPKSDVPQWPIGLLELWFCSNTKTFKREVIAKTKSTRLREAASLRAHRATDAAFAKRELTHTNIGDRSQFIQA